MYVCIMNILYLYTDFIYFALGAPRSLIRFPRAVTSGAPSGTNITCIYMFPNPFGLSLTKS